jgi:predicted unusual protein kinase regulating ubiquinone biosynthesis (AarF/ABC1/UbiB family)
MRILPGVLKELLKHVPTVLFEAVDWSVLGHELPKLSRRLIQKEGYQELFEQHQSFLRPFQINLVDHVDKQFDIKHDLWASEKILTLYFAQLFSPHGLFLDLRTNHFDVAKPQLNYHPSGLWTKFSDEFSQGLAEIYDGFYLSNDELFNNGLIKLGLSSPDWPQKDREELAQLFKSHFGSSVSQEMSFELESFKSSLVNITHFLLEKKVKISNDFLYLGIYLVTLYSALEKSRVRINVKNIYMDVRSQVNSATTSVHP